MTRKTRKKSTKKSTVKRPVPPPPPPVSAPTDPGRQPFMPQAPDGAPAAPPLPVETASQETPAQARERAAQCHAAVARVLGEFHCGIAPFQELPQFVGEDRRTIQISANYGIIPLQLPN